MILKQIYLISYGGLDGAGHISFYLSYLKHQILILYISFRSFMHFNIATAVFFIDFSKLAMQ